MTGKTIISVGSPRLPMQLPEGSALYLDGDHATAERVTIRFDDAQGALVICAGAGDILWPYGDIRELRDQAGGDRIVMRRHADPTARLVLNHTNDHFLLRARAANLDRSVSHVRLSRIAGWAVAAIASVALIIFVLVPVMADQLAEYLPPEGEKALGDATFEQIRTALDETGFIGLNLCNRPEGRRALDKIQTRLTDTMDLETPLTVQVLDHPMVNAFALPGGYVVFFRGLIMEADTPEEVAAVFAHEIGHVEARDPTRIALRSAGSIGVLGLLFGDFAGGALVLFLAEQIIQADYTQDAEAAADSFAHRALLAADLPPSAIATFFERLQDEGGGDAGILEHLQSHPALGDRIVAARAAQPADATFAPILTDAEWDDLQRICD